MSYCSASVADTFVAVSASELLRGVSFLGLLNTSKCLTTEHAFKSGFLGSSEMPESNLSSRSSYTLFGILFQFLFYPPNICPYYCDVLFYLSYLIVRNLRVFMEFIYLSLIPIPIPEYFCF